MFYLLYCVIYYIIIFIIQLIYYIYYIFKFCMSALHFIYVLREREVYRYIYHQIRVVVTFVWRVEMAQRQLE